jgi:hypothetical protein
VAATVMFAKIEELFVDDDRKTVWRCVICAVCAEIF